jgi:hypothetical protein
MPDSRSSSLVAWCGVFDGGFIGDEFNSIESTIARSGRYPIGIAIEAAGNGAATVRVRLDGIATAAAA